MRSQNSDVPVAHAEKELAGATFTLPNKPVADQPGRLARLAGEIGIDAAPLAAGIDLVAALLGQTQQDRPR